MTLVAPVVELPNEHTASGHSVFTAAFRCDNEHCHQLSIAQAEMYVSSAPRNQTDLGSRLQQQPDLVWTPSKVSRPEFPDVPQQIADTASEAHACLSIHAYRGAVGLARAVVEATAKDQGISRGPLVQKIDDLHSQGLIRDITRELAHEIREGGNEIAHGDLADELMPSEDANAIVALMDEILEEVYQGPARMMALKKSRLDRQQRNATEKVGAQAASS